MTAHLHCSCGWIWNHHGNTPLCVCKSVSRKAEQSRKDLFPGLESKTEYREERKLSTVSVSLCFPTAEAP